MHKPAKSLPQTKRAILYFTVYSAILFFVTDTSLLSVKTLIYFLVGFALSGVIAILFMSVQYRIEKLNRNFWVLNILIEIAGYYLFTQALFSLFF